MYGNIGAEKRIYYIFQFDETSISISTLYTNGGKKARLEVEIEIALVYARTYLGPKKNTIVVSDAKK